MNRKADNKEFETEPVSFDSTANVLSDDFLQKDYIKLHLLGNLINKAYVYSQ